MRTERHQFDVEGTGSLWLIECHDEGTKSLPVKAEDGSGLHRLDAKVEVHTTPPGIETCFSGNVWARDPFSLPHRRCARSDVGWGNRAWRQPAHKRVWQARKNSPVKCGRCAVDATTHAATDGGWMVRGNARAVHFHASPNGGICIGRLKSDMADRPESMSSGAGRSICAGSGRSTACSACRPRLRSDGQAATLDEAKAQFETAWRHGFWVSCAPLLII